MDFIYFNFYRILIAKLVLLLILNYSCSAQDSDSSNVDHTRNLNAAYIEISGNAPYFSLNYERNILQLKKSVTIFHTGLGIAFGKYDDGTLLIPSIPIEFSQLFFNKNHHLELGIGFTSFLSTIPFFDGEAKNVATDISGKYHLYYLIIPEIGYRFQKENGILIKFGFNPIIYNSSISKNKNDFFLGAGLSLGKRF